MTNEEYREKLQRISLERIENGAKTKRVLLKKLEEMAEIRFEDCANDEYLEICSTMNEIAKTLLDK